jgi:hypothetical protein
VLASRSGDGNSPHSDASIATTMLDRLGDRDRDRRAQAGQAARR